MRLPHARFSFASEECKTDLARRFGFLGINPAKMLIRRQLRIVDLRDAPQNIANK